MRSLRSASLLLFLALIAFGQSNAPQSKEAVKPYVIGRDDVLFLSVLHQPNVSQQLIVKPDGFVTIRLAGEVKAAGLTTPQLAAIVTNKLMTYFNRPEVNIQVVKIRSLKK